jgi:hypothetical protein
MFFRRQPPKNPTVAERLESLRQAGFTVSPPAAGAVEVARRDFAAWFDERQGALVPRGRAGVRLADELATLVDGGFQKFFRAPSGRQRPALASDLAGLHDFEEDLTELLGMESLYNESLGTVSTYYQYDRVQDRDRGVPKRVWEK